MTITIHRGINQIGGCITEIASASGKKILIDLGHNLPEGENRNNDPLDKAKMNLMTQFDIVDDVADFVLEMELRQTDNYLNNAELRDAEIAKLRTLRENRRLDLFGWLKIILYFCSVKSIQQVNGFYLM